MADPCRKVFNAQAIGGVWSQWYVAREAMLEKRASVTISWRAIGEFDALARVRYYKDGEQVEEALLNGQTVQTTDAGKVEVQFKGGSGIPLLGSGLEVTTSWCKLLEPDRDNFLQRLFYDILKRRGPPSGSSAPIGPLGNDEAPAWETRAALERPKEPMLARQLQNRPIQYTSLVHVQEAEPDAAPPLIDLGKGFSIVELTETQTTFRYQGRQKFLGLTAFISATARMAREKLEEDMFTPADLTILNFIAEIQFKKEGAYEGIIGYRVDNEKGFEAGRGSVTVQNLFRLDLFLAGLTEDGFVAQFAVETGKKLAVAIPIGTTGFAVQGFSGHFAHKYEPSLELEEIENVTPTELSEWVENTHDNPLTAWRPATSQRGTSGGAGLFCDVVTLADNGYLVKIARVGFGYLTLGPIIYFTGDLSVLDNDIAETTGFINLGTKDFLFQTAFNINIPPNSDFVVFSGSGSTTGRASFSNPKSWYLQLWYRGTSY